MSGQGFDCPSFWRRAGRRVRGVDGMVMIILQSAVAPREVLSVTIEQDDVANILKSYRIAYLYATASSSRDLTSAETFTIHAG